MTDRRLLCSVLALSMSIAGCGGVTPVRGGTKGTLTCGMRRLSDVQLTLFRSSGAGFEPVGFAQTRDDGVFELLQNKAAGPLFLSPGDYACTLETAGAPVQFPKEFGRPETTPLRVRWSDGQTVLQIEGPPVRLL